MIEISGWFIYGFSVGLMLWDKDDNKVADTSWGCCLYLGVVAVNIVKHKVE